MKAQGGERTEAEVEQGRRGKRCEVLGVVGTLSRGRNRQMVCVVQDGCQSLTW